MIRAIGGAILFVVMIGGAFGQPAPAVRAFEVASVKLHEGPITRLGVYVSGSRLTTDTTVLGLIMWAYNLKNRQISLTGTALSAVGDNFYDVAAKAEGDGAPTRDEFRQMLRSLLADRFKLKVYTEMRETPVYELLVGKNGPKFKESAPDANAMAHVGGNGRNYELTMPKATMSDLIDMLDNSSFLGRPAFDKTGLTGTYDIKLTYTPDIRSNRESEPDPTDISIFMAVQEQLGLKLDPQKAMMEMLIVDHVEKPSGN
jgi:uncharacterized protein (TIGR03435 family)